MSAWGKLDRLLAGGQDLALDVVHGAAHLVGSGDVGRSDAGDGHVVGAVVPVGLVLVEALGDGVDAAAEAEVVLGDHFVAVQPLGSVDGERAGVDDAADVEQAGGLEAVVHAEDVDLDLRMGVGLGGAEDVGEVEHAVGFGGDERLDDVAHDGDVAVDDLDLVAERVEDGRVGVDVHAVDFVSVLDQASHDAGSDESAAAED